MPAVVQVVVAYFLGLLVASGVWYSSSDVFAGYVFQRHNYRDHQLPTAVGLILPLCLAVVAGIHVAIIDIAGMGPNSGSYGWVALAIYGGPTLGIAVGFSFLGLLDDLGGMGESGGFRGHIAAAFRGRVTTGFWKLVVGPLIALVAISGVGAELGRLGFLRDAALISLAANLANLFDRAPGRVNKVSQLAFVALLVSARSAALVPVAIVIGAAQALLPIDLNERIMLGDSGANALGAVLGLGVVFTAGSTTRWIVLVALLIANLSSEFVSFTKVIDSVGPLRKLDRLGAPHRPR